MFPRSIWGGGTMVTLKSTFVKQLDCLDEGEKHLPSYQPHLRSLAQGSQWTHDMSRTRKSSDGPMTQPPSVVPPHTQEAPPSHLILATESLAHRSRRCCFSYCKESCELAEVLGFAGPHGRSQASWGRTPTSHPPSPS